MSRAEDESASGPIGPALLVAPPRSRWRVALGAVVVLLLIGLGAAVVASLLVPRGGSVSIAAPSATAGVPDEVLTVVVHVLGAVPEPGLYRLPEGSRIVDAIAAAGGFGAEADRGALNLARVLGDAEQILVPVVGAAPQSGGAPGVDASGRVQLNTADREALETLPRVGPAMAERIIAWRDEHGGFRSIEDLRQVSGIGAKTFEALQALVTL